MQKDCGSGIITESAISITPVITKTTDYTVLNNDFTIIGDNAATPILFTMPSTSGNLGKEYVFKLRNMAIFIQD